MIYKKGKKGSQGLSSSCLWSLPRGWGGLSVLANMKVEIYRGNKQCDLQERKQKTLKVLALLACGSARGMGWVRVLWCFPGWASLCLCSG